MFYFLGNLKNPLPPNFLNSLNVKAKGSSVKTSIASVQAKESEKLSSNGQSGPGVKQPVNGTIQFGAGRGIRRGSQVSSTGNPIGKVGSLRKLLLCTPGTSTLSSRDESSVK